MGVFMIAWIGTAIRLRYRSGAPDANLAWIAMTTPVILQMVLFPLMAIAAQSTMYNAVRQFLFVPPAMAILAALGIRVLWQKFNQTAVNDKISMGGYVLLAVISAGMLIPIGAQIRLFPYTYTYFNALAALKPIDGNWATDYWRASGPDLVRITPSDGEVSCILIDEGKPIRRCAEDSTLAPYWDLRGSGDVRQESLGPDEYWLIRENYGDMAPPVGCALNNAIKRPLFGQEITMGQIFRCRVL